MKKECGLKRTPSSLKYQGQPIKKISPVFSRAVGQERIDIFLYIW
jgi:hypothetical protein